MKLHRILYGFFPFLAVPCGLQALSSPTRAQPVAPAVEAQSPSHRASGEVSVLILVCFPHSMSAPPGQELSLLCSLCSQLLSQCLALRRPLTAAEEMQRVPYHTEHLLSSWSFASVVAGILGDCSWDPGLRDSSVLAQLRYSVSFSPTCLF